ncbi:hypothetical protein Mal48_36340 [Thalassoglobus polymorphus]|uniref:Uncharacterized protein n=1 Tax=Thalassoglobus polymorphus TaxID=2527994 RepID=A0A517QRW3_9PLAN|nr:hypothetical protein Mal48_36340 [Thalassoglobus polymorphus]
MTSFVRANKSTPIYTISIVMRKPENGELPPKQSFFQHIENAEPAKAGLNSNFSKKKSRLFNSKNQDENTMDSAVRVLLLELTRWRVQ